VISRITMRAIHDRGTVFGVAPTGRDLVIPIIVIDRVSEGKIVEEWSADTITPFLEELAQQMRERERVEQELEIVERSSADTEGFAVLPHRWIVERTLGWLMRSRRLSKDYERMVQSSQTFIEFLRSLLTLS
jgi:hypothetical protein